MPPILFDKEILHFLNSYAINHKRLTDFVILLSDNNLLKGGVLVAMSWYICFSGLDATLTKNRKGIFNTVVFSFVSVFITRSIVHLATFRPRPFLNKELHLFIPENLNILAFSHESSFPSDNATLFMSLSYGLWKTNKSLGIIGIAYTICFIFLPRIYLGLHYPSDILFGSFIGIFCIDLGFRFNLSGNLNLYVYDFVKKKPQYFFPLLFILSYQIADLFEDARILIGFFFHNK
jgi:undecaprenyl-diphosphatase